LQNCRAIVRRVSWKKQTLINHYLFRLRRFWKIC
jgi:hypothetical protein